MNEWLAQLTTPPIRLAQAHDAPAAPHAPAALGASHAPSTAAAPAAPSASVQAQTAETPGAPAETHTTTAARGEASGAHGEAGGPHQTPPWVFFGFSMVSFLLVVLLIGLGVRKLRMVPRGLQNLLEMVVEMLNGLATMVMGPRGVRYAPFISTFFLYILTANLLGLIPPFKSATASLSITFGMGIVAFIAVQYFGFRAHGIKYLAHFLGPVWWMFPLLLPLELLAELIRPVSLSLRLYGNINGEEQVIAALATTFNPLVAVLMLPLQVLTSVLQALVFTLLVSVYISLATDKHDDHREAEDAAHA